VMNVDLFELANNHHWRTEFAFRTFGEPIPAYMSLPPDPAGFDEKSWTEFGFQNYYALLNCGFRLMPTAGTASGVHPVPLGWGRVYVNCPDAFSFESWMEGLKAGRSFVTTGPLMLVRINGRPPAAAYKQVEEVAKYEIHADMFTTSKSRRIELVQDGNVIGNVGGKVVGDVFPVDRPAQEFGYSLDVRESTWLAIRCFEELPDGRERFAHSAPIFIDVKDKPLRPRKAEVEYLISRVESQIDRNKDVLSPEALAEYREALARYQEIAKTAK
jgi:hypothetical protein